MTAIVFDLDGTLIDSAPDLLHAANLLLAEQTTTPLSLAELRSFIGNGTPKLVERVLRARERPFSEEAHETFMAHYMADPIGRTTLYPHVREALSALSAAGHDLAICTNKPSAPAQKVLDHFALSPLFKMVVGGDTLPVLKPDPRPLREAFSRLRAETGVFIGDSDVDAATGQVAGIPFGLFTEGYRKSTVEDLQTAFTFADFATLPDLIAQL